MSTHSTPVRYRVNKKYPGYRVGDDGSVWSCKKGGLGGLSDQWKKLKLSKSGSGHLSLVIIENGRLKHYSIHRLVLEAFVGPCPEGMECCHFPDNDPSNNRLDNLRWDTRQANVNDRERCGNGSQGEKHGNAKLTDARVKKIRKMWDTGQYSQIRLAELNSVTPTTISGIVHRKRWTHIKE